MGNQRMRPMKYERKRGEMPSGKPCRKKQKGADIDKLRADRQRRRALRNKKEWLDLLAEEDLDEATQYPA
jgi:hypothetical protein